MEIRLEKLYKTFTAKGQADGRKVTAVSDFSAVIPDGKIVCLLGPSGCGKSTLLNIINGLETPDSGKVYFGEKDVTGLSPESRAVGMVFQNYALYPHMDVRQNIRMPLENPVKGERLGKAEQNRRVEDIAGLLQIGDLLDRRPNELSGGQQQRVSIARALIGRPEILLMDEPLSNLDKMLRMQILEEIRRIQKELHVTTLFVTHDQEEAMRIADLIIVMKEGMIQQSGTPEEVYYSPLNLFTARFLGYPEINVLRCGVRGGRLMCGQDVLCDLEGTEDGEVLLGIRPEDMYISEGGPLLCVYDHSEMQGKDRIMVCDYKGHTFKCFLSDGEPEINEGEELRLGYDKGMAMLFSAEDEKRIVL